MYEIIDYTTVSYICSQLASHLKSLHVNYLTAKLKI